MGSVSEMHATALRQRAFAHSSDGDFARSGRQTKSNARVEQRQMVALRDEELLARRVGFLRAILRPVEDLRHGEHRNDGGDLVGAP